MNEPANGQSGRIRHLFLCPVKRLALILITVSCILFLDEAYTLSTVQSYKGYSDVMKKTAIILHWMHIRTFAVCALLLLGGCKNFLEETAQKETPAAILFETKKLLNKQLYTEAIEKVETLTDEQLAQRDVAVLRASAYAGRCGLNFINFVDGMKNMGDSTTLFQLFLESMQGAVSYVDCLRAEDFIEAVAATAAARTDDENLLVALVSFAKIGAILAITTDTTPADGTADTGFNACTGLDDTQAGEIGTGMSIALQSLAALSSDVVSGATDDINTICDSISICSQTDPAGYSAFEIKAIKTLVHNNDGAIGLATNPGVICL